MGIERAILNAHDITTDGKKFVFEFTSWTPSIIQNVKKYMSIQEDVNGLMAATSEADVSKAEEIFEMKMSKIARAPKNGTKRVYTVILRNDELKEGKDKE